MNVCDSQGIELNYKIGILKELHKRQLINKKQLEKAIKIIKGNAKGGNKT